jgi:hypothetical protein
MYCILPEAVYKQDYKRAGANKAEHEEYNLVVILSERSGK